ncbi:MAG: right-handed parallel beta-helix repeat-containing protein [Candidatus Heimdallarchaeota archaeon]|nr:right-handed parallel beta-helix repeat-containing protein [Candidatus Heimdallarchaeota archaeon]
MNLSKWVILLIIISFLPISAGPDTDQVTAITIFQDLDIPNYASSGDGSVDDPYIIENYDVDYVIIEEVTGYITLRNINLRGKSSGTAISLQFAHHITIEDSSIVNFITGIFAADMLSLTLMRNTFSNLDDGVEAYTQVFAYDNHFSILSRGFSLHTPNSQLDNNYIDAVNYGIEFDAESMYFSKNHISGATFAIFGTWGNYPTMRENVLTDNREGIWIDYALNATIIANDISTNREGSSGIVLFVDSQYALIANNSIHAQSRGVYLAEKADHARILHNHIDTGGIMINSNNADSMAYIEIKDNYISNSYVQGIEFYGGNINNAVVDKNIIYNSVNHGIFIWDYSNTNNNNVTSNVFVDNNGGAKQIRAPSDNYFRYNVYSDPYSYDYVGDGGIVDYSPSTSLDLNTNGFNDSWEVRNGFHPFDDFLSQTSDFDGDGFTDWIEYKRGMDPRVMNEKIDSSAIIINSIETAEQYALAGDGSEANPFIISGYRVYAPDSPGILISMIPYAFIIEYNEVYGEGEELGIGVEFTSSNIIVRHNYVHHKFYGINTGDVRENSVIIHDNLIQNTERGISSFLNAVDIHSNVIENVVLGIEVYLLQGGSVNDNSISASSKGINNFASQNVEITNNQIWGPDTGIASEQAGNNSYNWNRVIDTAKGMDLRDEAQSRVIGNQVEQSGMGIQVFQGAGIDISDNRLLMTDGMLLEGYLTGMKIHANRIEYGGIEINPQADFINGLEITENIIMFSNGNGIDLLGYWIQNGIIRDNFIAASWNYGIFIDNSDSIINNIITNNAFIFNHRDGSTVPQAYSSDYNNFSSNYYTDSMEEPYTMASSMVPAIDVTPLGIFNWDNDTFDDGWEWQYGFSPFDPNSPDPAGDPDNDGYTNEYEYLNGMDPTVYDDVKEQHGPILITNDAEIAQFARSGTGSQNDPYIISNLYIVIQSGNAIEIRGTTQYISIFNNYLSTDSGGEGIVITNTAPNTIIIDQNTIDTFYIGIHLNTNEVLIKNNEISGTDYGIYNSYGNDSRIEYNSIFNPGMIGIFVDNAFFIEIYGNYFDDGSRSSLQSYISMENTFYSNFEANIFTNGNNGITIYSNCLHLDFRYNVFLSLKYIGLSVDQLVSEPIREITIEYNDFFDCEYGINVYFMQDSLVYGNIFYGNIYFGVIYQSDTSGILTYYNLFMETQYETQSGFTRHAYSQNENWFDDGNTGNFWDDYDGNPPMEILPNAGDNHPLSFIDMDGDNIADDWELRNGLYPRNPSDANEDFDNDGYSNIDEYYYGSDPNNRNSVPQSTHTTTGGTTTPTSTRTTSTTTRTTESETDDAPTGPPAPPIPTPGFEFSILLIFPILVLIRRRLA